jgi:hypothetical protein
VRHREPDAPASTLRGSEEVPMRRFMHIFLAALLGAAAVTTCLPNAEAGRQGGPASGYAVIPANQSIFFDVPYVAGQAAIVTAVGNGTTNLQVFIYDADGHVAVGGGFGDRKAATMDVYRSGVLRVEVRNDGPIGNVVFLGTN